MNTFRIASYRLDAPTKDRLQRLPAGTRLTQSAFAPERTRQGRHGPDSPSMLPPRGRRTSRPKTRSGTLPTRPQTASPPISVNATLPLQIRACHHNTRSSIPCCTHGAEPVFPPKLLETDGLTAFRRSHDNPRAITPTPDTTSPKVAPATPATSTGRPTDVATDRLTP